MKLFKKFWELLSGHERVHLLLLVAAVIVMAVLEVVNVAAISPFLSVASNPGAIQETPVLLTFYEWAGFENETRFLILMGIALFGLMVLCNAWITITTWAQLRFAWSWNHRLSVRLLRRYLYRQYSYFLSRNTADLSKNILSEVQQITGQLLVPVILAVGRGVAALGIVVILVVMEPVLALLVTVVVGGCYALIYAGVRRKLSRIGDDRLRANQERFTLASEALGGIKDVKVLNKEGRFLQRFLGPSSRFSRHQATSQAISQVPRYGVEAVAFGTILLIAVYLIAVEGNVGSVVPILGLYAFAGYRLMPAVQQVFRAVAQARFLVPALETLLYDLDASVELPEKREIGSSHPSIRLQGSLEFRNVSYSYPGSENRALADLSLSIVANSTVGIVGATGSGKTTIADILLGLLRPSQGQIYVDRRPLADENVREWQRNLGYVPQQIFLTDASVAENIAFGVSPEEIHVDAVRRAAHIANIDQFVTNELPKGYETVVGERGVRLSGGQRQRLGIARALYHNPSVLIFDEATSALDNTTEQAVMDAVHSLLGQKTIIMIAHRLTTLRDCDVIFMLDRGRIVAKGAYGELLGGKGRFEDLTGVASLRQHV